MAARDAVSRSSSRTSDRANAPSHRTRRCALPLPWHMTAPVSLHAEAACDAEGHTETCVFRPEKRSFMRDASGFFPVMIGKKSRHAQTIEPSTTHRACDRVGAMRIARVTGAACRCMRVRSAPSPRLAPRMRAERRSHAIGSCMRERRQRRSRAGAMSPIGSSVASGAHRSRARIGDARDAPRAGGADATRIARSVRLDAAANQADRSMWNPSARTRRSAGHRRGTGGRFRQADAHAPPVAASWPGDAAERTREGPCAMQPRDGPC